jgi:hypothetical protein
MRIIECSNWFPAVHVQKAAYNIEAGVRSGLYKGRKKLLPASHIPKPAGHASCGRTCDGALKTMVRIEHLA